MKIQRVQRRSEPIYPSQRETEWKPALLSHVPARWEKSSSLEAMLGLLTISSTSCSDVTEEKALTEQVAGIPDASDEKREVIRRVQKATAVVAPILDEALAYDGRGTFGCEASEPAQFLAEDEALDLIREELEAAGLQLKVEAKLDSVMAPTGDFEKKKETEDWNEMLRGAPAKLARQKFTFDFGDIQKGVYVEYLSLRDSRQWENVEEGTAFSCNFAGLAEDVAKAFRKTKVDRHTVFGVFFDPLASEGLENPDLACISPEQERLMRSESWKADQKEWEKTESIQKRGKLRAQVRHFVEFLRKEGIVPSPE